MGKTIAAIFGTFNPVTRAHIAMGDIAQKTLSIPAEDVIFVPAKEKFLTGWKGLGADNVMGEELRLAMLRAAAGERGFSVSDCEISGRVSGYTVDTLDALRKEHDADEVFMVMGTDKLPELWRWHAFSDMMERNRFLVIDRSGESARELIADPECRLAPYADRFTEVPGEACWQHVSATQLREELGKEKSDRTVISALMPDAALSIFMKSRKEKDDE